MEEILSHRFGSVSVVVFTFFGFAFVGFGLGLAFWLDFRRRSSKYWRVAGWIVLLAGSLMGVFFGYHATQPEFFKMLTADQDGIHLDYYIFAEDIFVIWADVETISIEQNRLIVNTIHIDKYASVVVYRGDQERLLKSINRLLPSNNP